MTYRLAQGTMHPPRWIGASLQTAPATGACMCILDIPTWTPRHQLDDVSGAKTIMRGAGCLPALHHHHLLLSSLPPSIIIYCLPSPPTRVDDRWAVSSDHYSDKGQHTGGHFWDGERVKQDASNYWRAKGHCCPNPPGWLVSWSVGRSVGWSVGCFIGRSVAH